MTKKISYKPREIEKNKIQQTGTTNKNKEQVDPGTIEVAKKLSRHLDQIKEYKERIKAVDYLLENAKKLAGSPSYIVDNPEVSQAAQRLFGTNEIDFSLFEKSIELIVSEWEKLIIYSMTDVDNKDQIEKFKAGAL